MAAGTKQTYQELLAERNKLKARVGRMEDAMREAGQAIVIYQTADWVAVPLPQVQQDALRDFVSSSYRAAIIPCNGKLVEKNADGTERWEDILDINDLLPGYRHYVVRYDYSEADGVQNPKFWALVPF